jgi:hypothetical protein
VLFIVWHHEKAVAQQADATSICTGRAQASLDDRISACSKMIATQKADDERLAVLYTSRGAAWRFRPSTGGGF